MVMLKVSVPACGEHCHAMRDSSPDRALTASICAIWQSAVCWQGRSFSICFAGKMTETLLDTGFAFPTPILHLIDLRPHWTCPALNRKISAISSIYMWATKSCEDQAIFQKTVCSCCLMELLHVSVLIWQMEQVKTRENDKASQDPRLQMAQPTKSHINTIQIYGWTQ